MWVCSREGFPLTVGCSSAAGSSRYSSESIFIIDIQLLRDFGKAKPRTGDGTWVTWLLFSLFCNENMKASFSLLQRLLCFRPDVSLLTCLCEYLCILYCLSLASGLLFIYKYCKLQDSKSICHQ